VCKFTNDRADVGASKARCGGSDRRSRGRHGCGSNDRGSNNQRLGSNRGWDHGWRLNHRLRNGSGCNRFWDDRCYVLDDWCSGSRRSGAAAITDASERSAHLDGLVFLNEDLFNNSGNGGGNLGVHLVSGHLHDWFVDSDGVSDLFQPAGDGSFSDALSECRKVDVRAHRDLFSLTVVYIA